jgi:hypothetical protein
MTKLELEDENEQLRKKLQEVFDVASDALEIEDNGEEDE